MNNDLLLDSLFSIYLPFIPLDFSNTRTHTTVAAVGFLIRKVREKIYKNLCTNTNDDNVLGKWQRKHTRNNNLVPMIVFLIFFLYYTTFRPSVVVFGLHLHSRAEHHTHSILSPASGRTRMHQFMHHHLHAHKRQGRPDEENSEYINITLHKYITLHDRGTSSPATRSHQTQMVCVCVWVGRCQILCTERGKGKP